MNEMYDREQANMRKDHDLDIQCSMPDMVPCLSQLDMHDPYLNHVEGFWWIEDGEFVYDYPFESEDDAQTVLDDYINDNQIVRHRIETDNDAKYGDQAEQALLKRQQDYHDGGDGR